MARKRSSGPTVGRQVCSLLKRSQATVPYPGNFDAPRCAGWFQAPTLDYRARCQTAPEYRCLCLVPGDAGRLASVQVHIVEPRVKSRHDSTLGCRHSSKVSTLLPFHLSSRAPRSQHWLDSTQTTTDCHSIPLTKLFLISTTLLLTLSRQIICSDEAEAASRHCCRRGPGKVSHQGVLSQSPSGACSSSPQLAHCHSCSADSNDACGRRGGTAGASTSCSYGIIRLARKSRRCERDPRC